MSWFSKRKEPVLTLPALITWLKTQDPNTEYQYGNPDDCLLARFVKSQGFPRVMCGTTYGYIQNNGIFGGDTKFQIPQVLNQVPRDATKGGSTYGAALELAEKLS